MLIGCGPDYQARHEMRGAKKQRVDASSPDASPDTIEAVLYTSACIECAPQNQFQLATVLAVYVYGFGELEIRMPNGALYEQKTISGWYAFQVGGTGIVSHGIYGNWEARIGDQVAGFTFY